LEWAQGTDGRMKLDPSDELVAFPALLTIDPGQSRTVRVADSNPPSSSERSFRLKITEIPEFQGPAVKDATTITLKSQFLLPVFYRPVEEKVAGAIAAAGVSRSTLSFSVTNTGTVHFRPKDVEVVGLGPGGKPVYNHTLEAWYVLSGGRRDYTLALPPATCASLAALSITVQTDVPLKQTLEVQPSACRA
jgi:fimbrial chaperone protein